MSNNNKNFENDLLHFMIQTRNNKRQFEKSDEFYLPQDLKLLQFSTNEIIKQLLNNNLLSIILKYIIEIKIEKINSGLKAHGERHIYNVILYSALIGQEIVDNEEELEILLIAAKYHDISRKTDKFEQHAEKSSEIAINKLKEKYDSKTLSIIKTLIEFHEIPRNTKNVDDAFSLIALKNRVLQQDLIRTRILAEILKDADALDRTRFINKARLDYKYLKYDYSKKLVKFAASLQETYAISDLSHYNCNEEINQLLNYYTPQEILRILRKNPKLSTNDNVKEFINEWLSVIYKQKNYKKK